MEQLSFDFKPRQAKPMTPIIIGDPTDAADFDELLAAARRRALAGDVPRAAYFAGAAAKLSAATGLGKGVPNRG